MSTGESWGTFLCLGGGIPGPKSMQKGVGRMMFGYQRRWSWLQSLGGEGTGSAQVLRVQDTGSSVWMRRLLRVLGPSSVWVLHASLQVEQQKELGLNPEKRVGLPLPLSMSCQFSASLRLGVCM